MWNLKVQFEKLNEAVDFLNGIRKIKKIEYHIEKNENFIYIKGDNEYSRELLLEVLSEFIVSTYKTKYFFENIKLTFLPKEHREALIKALVLFDIDSDIYYVLSLLERVSTLFVPSFHVFRLNKLKNKWNEFVFIANLNGNYLLN